MTITPEQVGERDTAYLNLRYQRDSKGRFWLARGILSASRVAADW